MKIIINKCYGGWGLSDKAFEKYLDLCSISWYKRSSDSCWLGSSYFSVPIDNSSTFEEEVERDNFRLYHNDIERTDPILIQVIEELGEEESSSRYSKLKIVEIPDDVEWEIQDYDGSEWIAEKHRTWH